jgi:AraC family transcriptional regulator of arabinose operon
LRCAIDRRIATTVDFLRNEWKEPGRLEEIAARVGLSSSRLTHLFRESTQLSIRAFIQEHRLRHAAELLATTEERVAQIAYAAGFRDTSNFNHAFKRTFGVSPKVYRLAWRGEENAPRDTTHATAESTNE